MGWNGCKAMLRVGADAGLVFLADTCNVCLMMVGERIIHQTEDFS